MKLTWFGGTTIRIHIGGAILVGDPDGAPGNIDSNELISGADRVFAKDDPWLTEVDAASWKPRKPPTALDDDTTPADIALRRVETDSVLIDALGEPPLLLVGEDLPGLGRWSRDAVIVLFGTGGVMAKQGLALLKDAPPRLIVLAGDEVAIEHAVAALREHLDGTGLMALEAGLALEA
ncbi:hypothetical protein [Devosia sp.]|uniref:hypothetical protein n=1 Tax=Devosia sp. TaxID=1871048 RepID=UPI0032637870